ncbi:MAG: metallophosphoesterase [Ignavibacteria bacterium]|jgi:3',5'-cyclic AMP phosphodiesterase CpdA
MKIAHLSDLHFSRKFKSGNIKKFKKLIKFALDQKFDHLIITGDISDNAEEMDFEILKGILQNNGLWDPQKVSVTIGNHDIFGGVQTALDVVNFPSKCRKTDYDARVSIFYEIFKDLIEGAITFDDTPFPYCKIIDNVAIFALNSIDRYSKLKNPFASNGKVYKGQFLALEKLLKRNEVEDKQKLVMVHHHFYKSDDEAISSQSQLWNKIESYTLKLRGKKKLMKLFRENGVSLVLHGHSHELVEYFRKGIRFVNAGASIDNHNPEYAAIYFINIEKEKISVKLETLRNSNFEYSKEKFRKYLAPSLVDKSA